MACKYHEQTNEDKFSFLMNQLNRDIETLDSIDHVFKENSKNIRNIEIQFQNRYNILIEELNKEKSNAMNILDKIKGTNGTYANLKSSMKQILKSLKSVQSIAQPSEITNNETIGEEIRKIEETYEKSRMDFFNFKKNSCSLIKGVDDSNMLLGKVLVEEVNFDQLLFKNTSLDYNENIEIKRNLINPYPIENQNIEYSDPVSWFTEKMLQSTTKDPNTEIAISHQPNHLANYNNLIFVCDDYGTLSVYEASFNNLHLLTDSQKLNFTNIRNISVNSNYLGVTYADLNKNEIKKFNNKLPESGVCLFGRNGYTVSQDLHSFMTTKSGFNSPRGLVLSEEFIYVSDKKKIYKFDFYGKILQKLRIEDKIYDISINSKFLIMTNYSQHKLKLRDLETLSVIKEEIIKQNNEFDDGPFNVEMVDDSLIFVLNDTRKCVFLYDKNLKYLSSLSVRSGKMCDIAILNSSYKAIIIGCRMDDNTYKIVVFN